MNLQEQISRIQSMMGVITEDRMDKVINNMISTIGLENTFKMVGDYNLVEPFLTYEDRLITSKMNLLK